MNNNEIKEYYANGELKSIIIMNEKNQKEEERFFLNFKLIKNGLSVFNKNRYDLFKENNNTELEKIIKYKNGKINLIRYYEENKIIKETEYKNEILINEKKFSYYEDGKLKEIINKTKNVTEEFYYDKETYEKKLGNDIEDLNSDEKFELIKIENSKDKEIIYQNNKKILERKTLKKDERNWTLKEITYRYYDNGNLKSKNEYFFNIDIEENKSFAKLLLREFYTKDGNFYQKAKLIKNKKYKLTGFNKTLDINFIGYGIMRFDEPNIKREGEFKIYDKDKILKQINTYQNDQLNGKMKEFDKKGNIIDIKNFKDNLEIKNPENNLNHDNGSIGLS